MMSTWNFILSGSDGATYTFVEGKALTGVDPGATVGTMSGAKERTWPPGRGPAAADGRGVIAGHAVWSSTDGPLDQALVRLRPKQRWNSAVCGFGQPTSVDASTDSLPAAVAIYGQARTRAQRPYTDYLPYGRPDREHAYKSLPVSAEDWSAPVLSGDNQALGFLSKANVTNGRDGLHPAGGWIFRLTPLMERAGQRLGITLQLEHRATGVAR